MMGDPQAAREPDTISGRATLTQAAFGAAGGHSGRAARTFCARTSAAGPAFTSTVAVAMT